MTKSFVPNVQIWGFGPLGQPYICSDMIPSAPSNIDSEQYMDFVGIAFIYCI